jgi:hypothetical protein
MTDRRDNSRHITARRGSTLVAKSWQTEAAVRMLMNNLDAEVAEDPQTLTVYGGIGRAARNWACYDKIVETLERTRPCSSSRASPSASSAPTPTLPACSSPTPTSSPNGRHGKSSTNSIAPG